MADTELKLNLKPLGDRLVVKPASREEMTASGIVLPDTAKEKPQRGTVIAAGEGRRDDDGDRVEMDVKVGDEVLFAKYRSEEHTSALQSRENLVCRLLLEK